MEKIDNTDLPSFYMNPSVYTPVKNEIKKNKGREVRRTGFQNFFESLKSDRAGDLGPLKDLPVSEETVNMLMDEVRSSGDVLLERPFPEEIAKYKQSVRNFVHYVVDNSFKLEHEIGLRNIHNRGAKNLHKSSKSMEHQKYTKITVIDAKLENLAAMLLTNQRNKVKLVTSLEEIKGLLIDLMQ